MGTWEMGKSLRGRPNAFPSHTRAPAREPLQKEVLGTLFERGLANISRIQDPVIPEGHSRPSFTRPTTAATISLPMRFSNLCDLCAFARGICFNSNVTAVKREAFSPADGANPVLSPSRQDRQEILSFLEAIHGSCDATFHRGFAKV